MLYYFIVLFVAVVHQIMGVTILNFYANQWLGWIVGGVCLGVGQVGLGAIQYRSQLTSLNNAFGTRYLVKLAVSGTVGTFISHMNNSL